MKKFLSCAAVVAAVAAMSVSCSNKENPEVEKPQEVVIPETVFIATYKGDYYETGNANAFFNLSTGELTVDDYGDVVGGNGQVVCIDLNVDAPQTAEERDHYTLQPGTYTAADDSRAVGTVNLDESYVLKAVDDKLVYENAAFTDINIVVTEVKAGVKVVINGTLEGGDAFTCEYEGHGKFVNTGDDAQFSNLDGNVKVGRLSQGSYASIGDVPGDEKTETVVITLGDINLNLDDDYGYGESVIIYVNNPYGESEVLPGHYELFEDLYRQDLETLTPGSLVSGSYMWGVYGGCWYQCPATGVQAGFVGGYVDIAVNETKSVSAAPAPYVIKGEFVDYYGCKVSFSYEGDLKKSSIDME